MLYFILFLVIITSYLPLHICCKRKIKINELGNYYGGLNIEGIMPYQVLNRYTNKRWYNIILVLDRPMIDNIVFDEIVKNKKYPTLENEIIDINEHEMFKTMLYVTLCEMELLKSEAKNKDIMILGIHFHQDKNCSALIKEFDKLLNNFITKNGKDFSSIKINYYTDDPDYYQLLKNTPKFNYDNCNSLISFSQCAGFEKDVLPGEFLVPNIFSYYDIDKKEIYVNNEQDFVNSAENLIEDRKLLEELEQYINTNYVSANPNKNHYRATSKYPKFSLRDMLQVTKLWNPTENDSITIYS